MVKFVDTDSAGTDADKYDRTGVSLNFELKIEAHTSPVVFKLKRQGTER